MADYQEQLSTLEDLGVAVVAASVDSQEDAAGTVERLSLTYPVLWGLDAGEVAERYGAFTHEDGYLQPANFLIRNGEIQQMTYSSGPLGRLRPEEVVQWVRYMRSQES